MRNKLLSLLLMTTLSIGIIPTIDSKATTDKIDYYDMKTYVGNVLTTAAGVKLAGEDMQRANGIKAWEACKDSIEVKIGEQWINGKTATNTQLKTWDGTFRATANTAKDVMDYVTAIPEVGTEESLEIKLTEGDLLYRFLSTSGTTKQYVYDISQSNNISLSLDCERVSYSEVFSGSLPDNFEGRRELNTLLDLDNSDVNRPIKFSVVNTGEHKVAKTKLSNLTDNNSQYYPLNIRFHSSENISIYRKETKTVPYTPEVKAGATIDKFNSVISKTSVVKIPQSFKYTNTVMDWASVEKAKVSVKSTDKPTTSEIVPIEINVEPYLEVNLSKPSINMNVQDMDVAYSDEIALSISSNLDYTIGAIFEGLNDVSAVELSRDIYKIKFDNVAQTFTGAGLTTFAERVTRGNNKPHTLALTIVDNTKLKVGSYSGELQLKVSQL